MIASTLRRSKAAIGGGLMGLALLGLTTGALVAQEPTSAPAGTPAAMADDMGMMGAATPAAGDPEMAGQMQRMMEQCMQMMEMMMGMMGMMGGDMSGMMGGQGMEGADGMQGMQAATPTPAS